jgi:RecB family exonuclease
MPVTKRLFVSGWYAVLEQAAIDLLRTMKRAGDPLAPLWVVVPTNILRQHLGRRVADGNLGHANLRFLTLIDLASELVEAALLRSGRRPITGVAQIALLCRVLRTDDTGVFAPLAGQPGFHRALLATFNDLADAEIDPPTLAQYAARAPEKLRTLARLYAEYRAALVQAQLFDRNELLRTAAEHAAHQLPPGGQIVWYGFYDFTPLQRRLLAEVARHASVVAFTPWEDGPRFAYATPSVTWLRSLGFELRALDPPTTGATDLARAQRLLFDPPAAYRGAAPDGSLQVISTPGETREAREVVRAVFALVRERGMRFDEIAVLLRTREPYGPLIVEALTRSGVPVYFEGGRSLRETAAGRALVLLLRVFQDDFARPAVIEFITTAAIPFATLIDHGARCTPAQWDLLSAAAGVVAGRAQWLDRLRALGRRYEAQRARDEDPAAWLTARTTELDRCQRFMTRFLADLDGIPRHGTWRAIVGGVLDVFVRYVEASEPADRVRTAVAALAELDVVTGSTTFSEVAAAILEALADTSERVGRFGGGVFVGDIMPSRGVPFRAVIIPGAAERVLPRPIREDPLLLDDERRTVSEQCNRELADKQRGSDEERLLFTLMLRSAREAAVVSFPRLNVSTARERLPSSYVLQLLGSVSGERVSYRDLSGSARVKTVALSALLPPSPHEAIDPGEVHLCAADAAIATQRPTPLSGLIATAPFFVAAARAEAARVAPAFTAYDGRLGPAAQARLAHHEWVFSTRLLHLYAGCPYRFFLSHLLGIEDLDEPERVQAVTARDRGSLVHGILRRFYVRALQEGIVPLRAQHAATAAALLESAVAETCAEFEREGFTGLPLLWRRQQEELRARLRRFLAVEIEAADAYTPTHFEYAFGDDERPVSLALASGEVVRLRGRIDRVDITADGRGRVIDYKSGKPVPDLSSDTIDPAALQLPFYLHAMRTLDRERRWEAAELRFISDAARFARVRLDAVRTPAAQEAALADAIARILQGIRAGDFRAGPPSCVRCEFPSICGTAAERFARKRASQEGM